MGTGKFSTALDGALDRGLHIDLQGFEGFDGFGRVRDGSGRLWAALERSGKQSKACSQLAEC